MQQLIKVMAIPIKIILLIIRLIGAIVTGLIRLIEAIVEGLIRLIKVIVGLVLIGVVVALGLVLIGAISESNPDTAKYTTPTNLNKARNASILIRPGIEDLNLTVSKLINIISKCQAPGQNYSDKTSIVFTSDHTFELNAVLHKESVFEFELQRSGNDNIAYLDTISVPDAHTSISQFQGKYLMLLELLSTCTHSN